jgi:pseudaminic acid biosynthesis-associated methylase
MDEPTTEQFWAGGFGDEYTARNTDPDLVAANVALFEKVLALTEGVGSVVELGANAGNNLRAIRKLLPEADLAAVEINPTAAAVLRDWGECEVHEGPIRDFSPGRTYDLALIKGVLIHHAPADLPTAYDRLVEASNRYVCVVEYYNPTPVEVTYRGHREKLWKRDFAGDLLDGYPLRLVDYGFVYHRDPVAPQDDLTWFLLEKTG